MQKLLGLIFFVGILTSCSKDSNKVEFDEASDYYQLVVGAWHVYDVDSIYYNDFEVPVLVDTLTYQVREELTDTFYDLSGNLSYEITRSKRSGNDTTDVEDVDWKISDVWWVKVNGGNIERVEENIQYVSLLNPVKEGLEWDGNAFNYIESWDFKYENVDQPYGTFPNTVTVNQKQEDVVIIYKDYREVYAKGVGLVSRTRIDVESQATSNPVPIIDKAEKGFQFFQTLKDYYIPN